VFKISILRQNSPITGDVQPQILLINKKISDKEKILTG